MSITNLLFLLQFLILSLHACEVTYLKGTCSAGKSTYIRSLPDTFVIVDEDVIMHRFYVEAVAVRFPIEFAIISKEIADENLYHALREKEVVHKTLEAGHALKKIQDELDQDLPWRQNVSQKIDEEVLSKIRDAYVKDQNVILDSWYIKPERLELEFPDAHIIKVLLYCPLSVAYERFLKRNKESEASGNLSEKRYLRQLVGSYFSLYQLSADRGIEKVNLDTTLDQIEKSLVGDHPYKKPVFTFEEISRGCFQEMRCKFMQNGSGDLYIEPRDCYDKIIVN